jgi:hypothetical protein
MYSPPATKQQMAAKGIHRAISPPNMPAAKPGLPNLKISEHHAHAHGWLSLTFPCFLYH